jgi:hypothetical protein
VSHEPDRCEVEFAGITFQCRGTEANRPIRLILGRCEECGRVTGRDLSAPATFQSWTADALLEAIGFFVAEFRAGGIDIQHNGACSMQYRCQTPTGWAVLDTMREDAIAASLAREAERAAAKEANLKAARDADDKCLWLGLTKLGIRPDPYYPFDGTEDDRPFALVPELGDAILVGKAPSHFAQLARTCPERHTVLTPVGSLADLGDALRLPLDCPQCREEAALSLPPLEASSVAEQLADLIRAIAQCE